MKIAAKSLTQLILGTLAGIGVFYLLLPQAGWAEQAGEVNPLQDFDPQQNSENSDPFSRPGGDSLGVFDLIHRAQLGNIRSADDYSTEQNENLDAAAAQFRQMQRTRIQGQQQASPQAPVTKPQVAN